VTGEELRLRARIFDAFARTGAPPEIAQEERPALRALAERHVVVLDGAERVVMAHPFSVEREGATRVGAGGRAWFGNCAWDGLGLVAALGLGDATVESTGVTVRVRDGVPLDDAVFHVLVPARDWWADVWFT
jgi:hypothetical protein